MHIKKESTMHLFNPTRAAALAALGVVLALSLAHPAASHAEGTYVHQSCQAGQDLADATGGWQPYRYPGAGVSVAEQCAWGGLHSELYPNNPMPAGEWAGWTYVAPQGVSISRIAGAFAGWAKPWDGSQGVLQVFDHEHSSVPMGVSFNGAIDPAHRHAFDWDGLSTGSVIVRAACDPDGGACVGSTAWASFYEPRIFLEDRTRPAIGSVSGSVTTDTTFVGDEQLSYSASDVGGGIARLRVYVDGQLSSIDHVIDDNDGACAVVRTEDGAWTYRLPTPCPRSVSGDETIDTTKLPDGTHAIAVRVVDAAQREATVWSGSRRIANRPPVNAQLPSFRDNAVFANPLVGAPIEAINDGTWAGPDLTVTRNWAQCDGHGSSASCAPIPGATDLSYTPSAADVGHRLRLLVTAKNAAGEVQVESPPTGIIASPSSVGGLTPKPVPTDGDPGATTGAGSAPKPPTLPATTIAPSAEHAFRGRVVGEASGTGCPQEKATLKFEHVSGGKLKLGHGRSSTAQVQLMCTNNGKAIEGAQLDVVTRVGSRAAVASDVLTDGAGHATLRLAAGAGRAIAVGYRMYADDPIARATATLRVSVNGRVRLHGNHRTLHNGRALTLTGRLLGGYVPKRGVSLTVQWKDHHRWRPFAQIKTTKKGTFRYAYKFTRTNHRLTYTLRVQVSKGQLDYPFLAVASNAVKVTVAP
jgi:hypothetical protein